MKKLLRDPRLGLPAYAFITPDHNTHLAIYRDHIAHRWVYDLFENDGMLLPKRGRESFSLRQCQGRTFYDESSHYSVAPAELLTSTVFLETVAQLLSRILHRGAAVRCRFVSNLDHCGICITILTSFSGRFWPTR
ncbi:MAG: hypothetical protein ACYCUV_13775 [Phycisphaerae bacterium]